MNYCTSGARLSRQQCFFCRDVPTATLNSNFCTCPLPQQLLHNSQCITPQENFFFAGTQPTQQSTLACAPNHPMTSHSCVSCSLPNFQLLPSGFCTCKTGGITQLGCISCQNGYQLVSNACQPCTGACPCGLNQSRNREICECQMGFFMVAQTCVPCVSLGLTAACLCTDGTPPRNDANGVICQVCQVGEGEVQLRDIFGSANMVKVCVVQGEAVGIVNDVFVSQICPGQVIGGFCDCGSGKFNFNGVCAEFEFERQEMAGCENGRVFFVNQQVKCSGVEVVGVSSSGLSQTAIIIIGVVVGLIILIIIIIIVLVVIYKKRGYIIAQKSKKSQFDDEINRQPKYVVSDRNQESIVVGNAGNVQSKGSNGQYLRTYAE